MRGQMDKAHFRCVFWHSEGRRSASTLPHFWALLDEGQPPEHGIRTDLEHSCCASDAQAFGRARDDTHDEVDGGALPMKDRPEALQKVAATGDAEQLPPGTAVGMAIGADVPPSHPTPIHTVWIGAEVGRGVDLASAPPRGHDAGWRD